MRVLELCVTDGVLIEAGLMLVTEIGAPSAISSRRSASTMPSIACLEAA